MAVIYPKNQQECSDPMSNNGIWASSLNTAFIEHAPHAYDAGRESFWIHALTTRQTGTTATRALSQ